MPGGIVDLTSVLSGPFCTWLIASLGADVIKVESPSGDMARGIPPFKDGQSLYFGSLNRNKRSVVLDLKQQSGREALHRLLATTDVFIDNMRPGVRNRLGCSDDELLKRQKPKCEARDIHALDLAFLDMPPEGPVAGAEIGILPDPARTEHLAGADFQETSFQFVRQIYPRPPDRCVS